MLPKISKTRFERIKRELDKLVSIYLDGDIEREIYLERKDILMREKASLLSNPKEILGNREKVDRTLAEFRFVLERSGDLENTQNYLEWKRFFQKIGSNPEIKDKTVSPTTGELWDFVASAKGRSQGLPADFLFKIRSINFANVSLVTLRGIEPRLTD